MPEENRPWNQLLCPESDEDFHDPKAVELLPRASHMQTEVELRVVCKRCGARGFAALPLSFEQVVEASSEVTRA